LINVPDIFTSPKSSYYPAIALPGLRAAPALLETKAFKNLMIDTAFYKPACAALTVEFAIFYYYMALGYSHNRIALNLPFHRFSASSGVLKGGEQIAR
jgi:hypothetical protein